MSSLNLGPLRHLAWTLIVIMPDIDPDAYESLEGCSGRCVKASAAAEERSVKVVVDGVWLNHTGLIILSS